MSDKYYLNFDGESVANVGIYISNNSIFNIDTSSGDLITLCFWIKYTDNYFSIKKSVAFPSPIRWEIIIGNDKTVQFIARKASPPSYDISLTSDPVLVSDQWNFVCVTLSASASALYDMNIYINENIYSKQEQEAELRNFTNTSTFIIGLTTGIDSDSSTGGIDNIRVYKDKVLTSDQVAEIYNLGIGQNVDETEFASITDNGYYSNINNYPDDTLAGRILEDGVWSDYDSAANIDGVHIEWYDGGFPILPDNTRTVPIGTTNIAVAYDSTLTETSKNFVSPYILMTSYTDDSQLLDNQPSYAQTMPWQGIPLSISMYYDPELDPSLGDTVGYYFAFDVIENNNTVDDTSALDEKGITDFCTFFGSRLKISMIDGKYYLDIIRSGATSSPSRPLIFEGMPLSTGSVNEFVLNKTEYTMDDIEVDPNTDELDYKYIYLGGIPLTCGRVGNKYYLIVHPVAAP